jgi:glucose-1-phosphate adenylyltransferase
MLPPAKISGSAIHQSLVAEGSIIHASAITNSIVGIRSRIGKGTQITSCYIMGNDFYETIEEINSNSLKNIPKLGIGDHCTLTNVIVDKDCRIGNYVQIKGGAHLENSDHTLFSVKDGVVVIKKGAVIMDGFEFL